MKNKIPLIESTPEFQQSIDSMSNEEKNNVDNTLKTINMEKTAMQELIERLQALHQVIPANNAHNLAVKGAYVHSIMIAKEYLKKEWNQIVDAYKAGLPAQDRIEYVNNVEEWANDYFTQTFGKLTP